MISIIRYRFWWGCGVEVLADAPLLAPAANQIQKVGHSMSCDTHHLSSINFPSFLSVPSSSTSLLLMFHHCCYRPRLLILIIFCNSSICTVIRYLRIVQLHFSWSCQLSRLSAKTSNTALICLSPRIVRCIDAVLLIQYPPR